MKLFRRLLLTTLLLTALTLFAAAFDTSADSGLLMLVSKAHPVSSDYVPSLVELTDCNTAGSTRKLRAEAADAFARMYADMVADGVTVCNVISGYRSYDYQNQLVEKKIAQRMASGLSRQNAYNQVTMSTAPAGASEHQLGLALDLSIGTSSSNSFGNTAAGKWLSEHAWKYGFIRRYHESKSSLTGIVDEPWHYRYVGIPHAQLMVENDWCLEEYIAALKDCGSLTLTDENATYHVYWTQDESAEFNGIVDISRDNMGGWIITTSTAADPLTEVRGHWSEASFVSLMERGVTFTRVIDPARQITFGEFARLCGLEQPENADEPMKREDAAAVLESSLPDKTLTYLTYSDLAKVSGNRFQSLQIAVTNGIFTHTPDTAFRPTDAMTWAEAAATALRYLELVDPLSETEEAE